MFRAQEIPPIPCDSRIIFWTRIALALGLALRIFHYLSNMSIWHDEAALILNVLGKNFTELLGPLFFHEAAPPGFLWLEKSVSLILGDSPWALRLIPFLASIATLFLFARLAWRWLPPAAVPWAVFFMACSDRLLWHSCEAKPYMLDVLIATLVLVAFDALQSWSVTRRFWVYALFSPLLIFLVFPGCFLVGGLLAAELPALWRNRRPAVILAYSAWIAIVVVAFLLLLLGPIHAQKDPELQGCWDDMFPDMTHPWFLPLWTMGASLQVVQYAIPPVGEYLGLFALLPLIFLIRNGPGSRLALLVVPAGLALIASFLHAYPYGRSRVMAYAAPAIMLLVAEGCRQILSWLRPRKPVLAGALVMLLLLPLAHAGRRFFVPWVRTDASGASAYVLPRLQPGEQVLGTNWEFEYYFRRRPADCPFLKGQSPAPDRPLWLLVGSSDETERQQFFNGISARRRVLERREFRLITVAHLSPEQSSTFAPHRNYSGDLADLRAK